MAQHCLALIDPEQNHLVVNLVAWDGSTLVLDRLNATVAPKFYKEKPDRTFTINQTFWSPETESFFTVDLPPNKEDLRAFASAWRDTLFVRGVSVTINGATFTVQTRSEIDLANIKALKDVAHMNPAFTTPFRDADNNTHTLNAAQIAELYNQVVSRRLALTQTGISIKAAIDAGTFTTKAEIKNADWT